MNISRVFALTVGAVSVTAGAALAQDSDGEDAAKENWLSGARAVLEDAKAKGQDIDVESWIGAAREDIEKLGDWEYKIIELSGPMTERETALNALGKERWEVIWIETGPEGLVVYAKRPALSFTSRALDLGGAVAQ